MDSSVSPTASVAASDLVLWYPRAKAYPSSSFPHPGLWLALEGYAFPIRGRSQFPQLLRLAPDLRGKLEAFKERDINSAWSWYVQTTRKVTPNDFKLLTRHGAS
jgi:hypothetical protein